MKKIVFVIIIVFSFIFSFSQEKKIEEINRTTWRISKDKKHIEFVSYLDVKTKIKYKKIDGFTYKDYHDSIKTLEWHYESVITKYNFIYTIKPENLFNVGLNTISIEKAFLLDSVMLNTHRDNKYTKYYPFF